MADRSTSTLNEEAAEWFVRMQREDVSADDRRTFESWINAEPARAVAYARVEQTWERSDRLRAGYTVPEESAASRWGFSRRAAVAGIAALFAGAGGFWFLTLPATFRTEVGERRTVDLDDGSQLLLNTASRVEVAFSAERREVRLSEGEAMFRVAHDSARLFIVEAGGTRVRAVGTAFNVRLRGSLVEVTVTEGIVEIDGGRRIAAPTAPTRVSAGAGAVVGPDAISPVSLDADVMRQRTAWRDGLIELKGETLDQAVAEFNRYRRAPIVIGDQRVASIRVGGTFEIDESELFLSALRNGFNVRTVPGEGGTVYLMPAG